ncbi:inorganic pyrophosphatase [Enterococcus sp. BWM-S5]|uniref:inorganic diphosphatase n=1 Tax=Enterococcus larvae TaxID=2794352 RepID=A0ABS4CQL5_9ENTE|nr:inorganic diphosphatase [Enterococcus larvae]MBP1048370.1 inorganic pyrophosphatase [Enterococcus larvae]
MNSIQVVIDRPIGYVDSYGNMYPINYGYVEGVMGGDGEEQDVYILGVVEPLKVFEGEVIAVIHRKDDVEEKWVAAPNGVRYSVNQIQEAVHFIEQYFDSSVRLIS